MEHMTMPYNEEVVQTDKIQKRIEFISSVERDVWAHPFLDHELFLNLNGGVYNREFVALFISQYSKHIAVFTKALANLMGATDDLESRYMLLDNLFEEMGMGVFEECHYSLYQSMLKSMGISKLDVQKLPQSDSIEVLNDALFQATNDLVTGLTWLGIGGEQTIPNHFPAMRRAIELHWGVEGIDWRFFNRHGERDEMHADDAKLVLAMNMKEGDEEKILSEATKCLHLRAMVCDEFLKIGRDYIA